MKVASDEGDKAGEGLFLVNSVRSDTLPFIPGSVSECDVDVNGIGGDGKEVKTIK